MMRAWDNRSDTVVCDEPFYAHYLLSTGHTDHPGYEEIIAGHETDWRKVVQWLTGSIPQGKSIFYQKHMAHHVLPGMATDWIENMQNCFLIREPNEMLLSLVEFLPSPSLLETGLPQQVQLFEYLRERNDTTPPVIDATDVLKDPGGTLRRCAIAYRFRSTTRCLPGRRGPRSTDGVSAPIGTQKPSKRQVLAPITPKPVDCPIICPARSTDAANCMSSCISTEYSPSKINLAPQASRAISRGRKHVATIRRT